MKDQVVIIGGGAVGLCAALYAARAGARVLVLERERVGAGASWGNAGLVVPSFFTPLCDPEVIGEALGQLANPQGFFALKPRLDPHLGLWLARFLRHSFSRRHFRRACRVLSELGRRSLGLHLELSRETGGGYWLEQKGLLYLYADPAKLRQARQGLEAARRGGVQARAVSSRELNDLEPAVVPGLSGGILYQPDAMLRPEEFLRCLARQVRDLGGVILEGAGVYGFRVRAGAVREVLTTRGDFEAGQVVLACGAWLGELSRRLGRRRLPVEGGKGISLTFPQPPARLRRPLLLDCHSAVTPFRDGLRITGLLELCGRDLSIDPRRVAGIQVAVSRYLPWVKGLKPELVWTGLRPCCPDGLPIIGRLDGLSNLLVAGGHDQKGISLAPVTGQLVARLLEGRPLGGELDEALSPNRF